MRMVPQPDKAGLISVVRVRMVAQATAGNLTLASALWEKRTTGPQAPRRAPVTLDLVP